MQIINREGGFTIIELLITITILAFILAAIYSFYLAGVNSWNRSLERMENQQSARISLDRIIDDLRYAYAVELRDPDSEDVYREVRFKVHDDSRTLRYRLQSGTLVKNTHPTSHYHMTVALGITELLFSMDESNLISIYITAGQNSSAVQLSGSIRPRNIKPMVMTDDQ